jgi:CPA1 family monovalent cation:H+ antiporter
MRVHSFAVWASVVFLLNVLAFLLMGLQARLIIGRMPTDRLAEAARFAVLVIVAIVVTRFVVVMIWNRLAVHFANVRGRLPPPTWGQGVVVAWSGMRGLVTLATAFALPIGFPQRDLVVLTAFAVVLATLVVQGLTLAPLIRQLRLDQIEDPASNLADARRTLARVGLDEIDALGARNDLALRDLYALKCAASPLPSTAERLDGYHQLGLVVVGAQRKALLRLRDEEQIDMDAYYLLQEEIDWRELTLLPDSQRRIDEV